MLTQAQIEETISSAVPDILKGLQEEIKGVALTQAKESVRMAVASEITAWIKQELVPSLLITLSNEREGLIALAPAIAKDISLHLQESIKDTLKKKLENSWERKKIFGALFE